MDNIYDICKYGTLPRIIRYLNVNQDYEDLNEGFRGACDAKRLDVVELLYENLDENLYKKDYDSCLFLACKSNAFDIVKYAISEKATDLNKAAFIATSYGHLNLIKYFFQISLDNIYKGYGDEDDYNHINYTEINLNNIFIEACTEDRLDIIKFICGKLKSLGSPNLNGGFQIACNKGFCDIVHFLIEEKSIDINQGFMNACRSTYGFEVVKLLYLENLSENTIKEEFISAYKADDFEIVEFLYISDKSIIKYYEPTYQAPIASKTTFFLYSKLMSESLKDLSRDELNMKLNVTKENIKKIKDLKENLNSIELRSIRDHLSSTEIVLERNVKECENVIKESKKLDEGSNKLFDLEGLDLRMTKRMRSEYERRKNISNE